MTYIARDTVIFVSHTLKFRIQKNVDERGLWRHFLSYCRVTKRTQTFWMCQWHNNNMRRNLMHLSCTRGPLSRRTKWPQYVTCYLTSSYTILSLWASFVVIASTRMASIGKASR